MAATERADGPTPVPQDRKETSHLGERAAFGTLIAAALALPGMQAEAQDAGYNTTAVELDINGAAYIESDDRIRILEQRNALSFPVFEDFRVTGTVYFTSITGASPHAIRPATGMTDASLIFEPIGSPSLAGGDGTGRVEIDDFRKAFELDTRYYGNRFIAGVAGGYSTEKDYESRYFSANFNYFLNEKQTTLIGQVGYSDDTVIGNYLDPDFEDEKSRIEFLAGISHVLSRNSIAQFNVAYANTSGYLNDPYKGVWVVGDINLSRPEERPDSRTQWALYGQYSRYLESKDAALHVDYRYTSDDWETNSHTVNAEYRWKTDIWDGMIVAPSLRYYTQDAAFFYRSFLMITSPELAGVYSSDYRLDSFGSISPKLELAKTFDMESGWVDGVTLRAYYQYTDRRAGFALSGSGDEVNDFSVNVFGITLESDF